MVMFQDADEAGREFRDRVMGDDWWVFIPVGEYVSDIEERFYSGRASADFEVVMGPAGPLGIPGVLPDDRRFITVAYGHRRHLPPAVLADFLNERGAEVTGQLLEAHPAIVLGEVAE